MKINTIITAGGTSQRYGSKNKLFEKCGTSCVLVEAIKAFLNFSQITRIVVGIDASFVDDFANALDSADLKYETRIVLSIGGDTRTKTVKNALISLENDADYVLIHDGARPYVTHTLIQSVIDCATEHGVALPLLEMTDAIADISSNAAPLDRAKLRRVQTPFCAKTDIAVEAYKNINSTFYDDLSVIKTIYTGSIGVVEGDKNNIKITYDGDIKNAAECHYLTGCGYDIHRMKSGNGIKLLGIFIPCEYSFIAHSDGDVPIHALMDAILSALGEKDIGHLFPVDDVRYDGADSTELLRKVLSIAKIKGYSIHNFTVSVIAESPMLSAHIDAMRDNMSNLLGIPVDRIGVSATTNEQVGEIGDGKAIAAYCTVLMASIN